ncbi:hypothetical protein BH10BAC4_BH10BAC4_05880 [soil metagenome]
MIENQEVFFSIIIPTYNRAGFILNTLQSVFEQSFRNFEVIVVDNASEDETVKFLEPFVQQGKLKLIVHDRNYERAKSRNTGQLQARGRYVTFLDSDDFMYPDNLRDAHDFTINNPGIRLFHNLYEMVNADRKVVYRYKFNPLDNPVREIARGNFLSCIGVFIHQDIYQSLAWDETPILVGSEDYEFSLRLIAKEKKVGRIHKVNSGILQHEDRTMNKLNFQAAEKRFDFLINKVENDPALSLYKPYLAELKSGLFLFLAGLARKTDRKLALHYLTKAFTSNWLVLKSRGFYSIFFQLIAGFNRR